MSRIITQSNELLSDRLCSGDKVLFNVNNNLYDYVVVDGYLVNRDGAGNRCIFICLQLDANRFCLDRYLSIDGPMIHGDWPETRSGDMESLTRVVYDLLLICEQRNRIKVSGKIARDVVPVNRNQLSFSL
jgi:hypothetical protein